MNPIALVTISSKELRDILSERVYWLAFALELMIVLGVILLGIAFAAMMNPTEMIANAPEMPVRIGLLQLSDAARSESILGALMEEDVRLYIFEERDKLEEGIERGELMGGLVLPQSYDEMADVDLKVELMLDSSDVYSAMILARIRSAIDRANDEIAASRLASLGLLEGEVLQIQKTSIGESSIPINSPDFVEAMYLMVIPLVLIFPLMLSANMTSDSIVGEKEMGTLGILVATPVSRLDIVLGKVLPVLVLANVQFLAWLFLLENNMLGSITVYNKIPLLILLNLGTVCFVGASLLVSARARSTKESNLYLTLLIMIFVLPLFMGIPHSGSLSWILDAFLLVKTLGFFAATPGLSALDLLSHLAVLGSLAVILLALCVRSIKHLEPPPGK